MNLSKEEKAGLMDCLLDMGQLLLDCGAEISRAEDTLSRVAKAYGAEHVDVFVIPSIISLSIEFPAEEPCTETRRIYSSTGTDFHRLEDLNRISRSCCAEPVPPAVLKEKLRKVSAGRKSFSVILIGSVVAAGAFAVFFGGSSADAMAAAVFALGICLMQRRLGNTQIAPVGANLLISLLTGLGVGVLCMLIPVLHMDHIIMGDIMLLIPGLAMTNAVRNMLGGNTISGLIRLTECLIWACALAGGFMTAIVIIDLFW